MMSPEITHNYRCANKAGNQNTAILTMLLYNSINTKFIFNNLHFRYNIACYFVYLCSTNENSSNLCF